MNQFALFLGLYLLHKEIPLELFTTLDTIELPEKETILYQMIKNAPSDSKELRSLVLMSLNK